MQSAPEAIALKVLGERPGSVAVGLWRDNAAFYGEVRRAGVGAVVAPVAAQPQSLFEIGSISKVFTGVLLAQAVERGDLSLDDTLGKLLPKDVPLQPAVAAVTLRQLVTHSSCLPRMPDNFPNLNAPNPYLDYDRRMLLAALSALRLEHAGPCTAVYSNLGFAVLGELLSMRYGQPWEALVVERIAAPLGMRDTRQHLGAQSGRLAPAFSGDKPASQWDFIAFAGAGSLRSSAVDMLLFGRALMAGGGGPLGAAGARVLQPLGSINGGGIGYALMMRGPAERRVYTHDGGTGGYSSELLMMPDLGQVAVVMTSNAQASAGQFGQELLAERYKVGDRSMALDAAALPAYVGVFRVDAKTALTFVAQDGKLYGRLTGQPYTAMTAAAPDVFTLPQFGAEFTFGRRDGKVASVVLRQRGNEIPASLTGEPAPSAAYDSTITQQQYGGHYLTGDAAAKGTLDFEVRARDGQLAVRLNTQPMLPVFALAGKPDRYAVDVVAAEYQFERDAAGQVIALVLHQNGRAMRAVRAAP